jgi:hypothetical protein
MHADDSAYTHRGDFHQHLAELKERDLVLESAVLQSRLSEQSETIGFHEYTEAEKNTRLAKFQRLHGIGLAAFTLLSALFIGFGAAAAERDDWRSFTPTVGFSHKKADGLPRPHEHELNSFHPLPFLFVLCILAALYHLISLMMLRSELPTSKYYMFDQQYNPLRWVDHSIFLMLLSILLALCVGIHDVHLWFALGTLTLLGTAAYGVSEMASRPLPKLELHVRDTLWPALATMPQIVWRIGAGLLFATWLIYFCYLGNLPHGGISVSSQVFVGFTLAWQAFITALSCAYSLSYAPKFHQVDYAYLVASVIFRVTITIQLYFVFVMM